MLFTLERISQSVVQSEAFVHMDRSAFVQFITFLGFVMKSLRMSMLFIEEKQITNMAKTIVKLEFSL